MYIDLSEDKKKKLHRLAAAATGFVFLWIAFSPRGILPYYKLHRKVKTLTAENSILQAENEGIQKEIARLNNDTEYIVNLAREKYNLLKQNEIIFEFPPKKRRH